MSRWDRYIIGSALMYILMMLLNIMLKLELARNDNLTAKGVDALNGKILEWQNGDQP